MRMHGTDNAIQDFEGQKLVELLVNVSLTIVGVCG
jgi:hypothetical protein